MPDFSKYNFHLTPASVWVKLHPTKQQLLRENGGFPVNDHFIPLWQRPDTLKKEKVFAFGGYGSSKTTDRIMEHILLCCTEKYFKCFYGREVFDDAKKEFHSSIILNIKDMGIEDQFDFSEKPNGSKEIKHIGTGNVFIPFGCDDSKSMGKGWNNATHILIDEVNEISFKSYGMLLTRLRTKRGKLCFTGIFNTMDIEEDHWLCTQLYLNEELIANDEKAQAEVKRLGIIKHYSNFPHNHFIDQEEYKQSLMDMAGNDEERAQCILNAGWGSKTTANPFYKQFRRSLHVGTCTYDHHKCLHVSFDENVNPYLPFGIFQMDGTKIYMIDEIAAKNPHNTLRWVCNEICKRYKGHESGMIIYGDATSKKDDIKVEKGKNTFTIVKEYLAEFHPRLRVNKSNPNVAMRGNFINDCLGLNYMGVFVLIGQQCPNMIADLINTAESPDGNGKDKTKKEVDGVRGVQRWGHFSDLFDYIMCEAFRRQYDTFKMGGKKSKWVMPRREPRHAY